MVGRRLLWSRWASSDGRFVGEDFLQIGQEHPDVFGGAGLGSLGSAVIEFVIEAESKSADAE